MSLTLGNSPTNPPPPSSDNGGAGLDNASNEKHSIDGDGLLPTQNTLPGQDMLSPQAGGSPEQLKQVSEVLSSEVCAAWVRTTCAGMLM